MGKIVKRVELSEILGVSTQSIIKWGQEQNNPIPIYGSNENTRAVLYDTEKVIEWLLTRRGGGTGEKSLKDKSAEQDLRLATEKADALAIKNAILRREYAPIAVVSQVLSKVGAQIGSVLDTLPLNVKRRVPELENQTIELIKSEVVKTQNVIATMDDALEQAIDEAFSGTTTGAVEAD